MYNLEATILLIEFHLHKIIPDSTKTEISNQDLHDIINDIATRITHDYFKEKEISFLTQEKLVELKNNLSYTEEVE